MRRTRAAAAVLLGMACAPPPRPPQPATAVTIDTLALRAHTWFLAQDALRGRGTGDPVTLHAAQYIASQCLALGLAPVGDDYLHPVPLVDAGLGATSIVRVLTDTDTVRAHHGADFTVIGGTLAQLARPAVAPAVWLGDPDSLAADLPPLTGAVAVTAGPPDAPAAARIAAGGAVAVVALVGDDATLARFAAAVGTSLRFADPVPSSYAAPLPVVVAGGSLTRALVPLARGAARRVAIALQPAPRRVPAWNVACRLPGRDAERGDTAIAFTAHYDHLGVGAPEGGDSIYNGFSDDAAGVAMLLAIGEALSDPARRPRHAVLLLFFTAEERGLLGSDWWVARAPWPVERTRAVINLDAGAPPGRVWNWRLAGGTASWLGPLAREVAAERGWAATLSAPRANSDYFPFVRVGVPGVFPIPTPAPYEGLSADSSQALRARWDRYHRAGDEWFADFPFAGLARYAEYALAIGLAVDRR